MQDMLPPIMIEHPREGHALLSTAELDAASRVSTKADKQGGVRCKGMSRRLELLTVNGILQQATTASPPR